MSANYRYVYIYHNDMSTIHVISCSHYMLMNWFSYQQVEGMVLELGKKTTKPVTTVQDRVSTFVSVNWYKKWWSNKTLKHYRSGQESRINIVTIHTIQTYKCKCQRLQINKSKCNTVQSIFKISITLVLDEYGVHSKITSFGPGMISA